MLLWKKEGNLGISADEHAIRKKDVSEDSLELSIHCITCGDFKTRCCCKEDK